MRLAVHLESKNSDLSATEDREHPTDISWPALAPALSLSIIAAILVALRWFTRVFIVRKTGVDDWLISVSMVSSFWMMVGLSVTTSQICSIGMTIGIAIRMASPRPIGLEC